MHIKIQTLRAALISAPKKDVRYYLNGVYIEPAAGHVVSTDGSRMFVAQTGVTDPALPAVIIPRDVVDRAVRGAGKRAVDLELVQLAEGVFRLGTETFQPIEGKFPDYRRVLPGYILPFAENFADRFAVCNPQYLADAQEAVDLHETGKVGYPVHPVIYTGKDCAAVVAGTTCLVVIMPLRDAEFTAKLSPAAELLTLYRATGFAPTAEVAP